MCKQVAFVGFLLVGLLAAAPSVEAQTFTLQAAADTSLREGAPNQNRGSESVVQLFSGDSRVLLRFDQASIASAVGSGRLVSASLELFVRSAGGNWGADGRPLEAHRLTAAWTEAGATWNCAVDTQPANSRPDCATQWAGGTFEEDSSDTILQTSAERRWVQLDVTADVAAFLAGTSNQGWLLKKSEVDPGGQVEYVSREGAVAERPRLVLLVETAVNDQVPPSLAITSPSQPILVNEPSPTIAAEYADGGSGVSTATLQVLVDGLDITATCTAGPQSASCHPQTVAAGNHTVQVRLRDQAGNAAQASFSFQLLLGSGPHLVTFQAVGDTTLRKGEANHNQGAEPILRLREGGQNRALVRFDPQSLATTLIGATLVSASLEMHIEKNGRNWGRQGRTVDIHRMTAAWTETGATWNCPDDSIPSNQRADCATQWNGGSYAPTATASLLHTRDLAGWLSFNVTADVAAFVSGTPNHGWMIKKTDEKKSGRVDYDSRQGTAGEGPRLVLVFQTAGDTVAPELDILQPGANVTSKEPVQPIILGFSDAGSGIDLATLQVSIDGTDIRVSCTVREGSAACASPSLVSGSHMVQARIRDLAGNAASASLAFSLVLDQVPPSITVSITPTPNTAGWNNTPVTVTFSCEDVGTGVAICPEPVTVEAESAGHSIVGVALDQADNVSATEVTVNLDLTPPDIEISSPASGATTNAPSVAILGTVVDRFGVASADLNGSPIPSSSFTVRAPLADGDNLLKVTARDLAGNTATASVHVNRFAIPEVEVTSPASQTLTSASVITVAGTVSPSTAAVTVNGTSAVVSGTTFSAADVPLLEGTNTLAAVAVDEAGRAATATVQVIRDSRPPRLAVHWPVDGEVVPTPTINVQGMVNDLIIGSMDATEAEVWVNGVPAEVANRSFLAVDVPLALGANELTVTATDLSGNSSTARLIVFRQDLPVGQPRLRPVSGSLQSGPVGTTLSNALVVELTDSTGLPLVGRQMVFRVSEGDGTVSASSGSSRTLVQVSDVQGRAQVSWTLGTRAGVGKNRVEVTTPGIAGAVVFYSTSVPTAPVQISQDAGTRQFGLVGKPLPHPFVAVVTDLGHNRLTGVPVVFRVTEGGGSFDGQESITVKTDAYGRAQALFTVGPEERIENNAVEADFPGNAGQPAVFVATGKIAGDPAATQVHGVVLDNSNLPIAGVTVRIEESGQTTRTDTQGQFTLIGVPVGHIRLIIEGSTSDRPGSWPSLEYELITLPGRENTIGMPVYLLPLDLPHGMFVDETHGGWLTVPDLPGFSLEIAPGSATFPGGGRSGVVSVTLVHSDKVPMVPNFGQQPRFIVTIQPAGTRFDPPAAMTLPNVDGLAPGQVTEMYSFDHDLGMFVSIGTASVSADGSVLKSDPGVGVVEGGWHCGGNPASSGGAQSTGVRIINSDPPQSEARWGPRTRSSNPKRLEVGSVEGEILIKKDETITLMAAGVPDSGTYFWSADNSVVNFVGSPEGNSVQIKGSRTGKARVRVLYTCPSGATAEAEVTVKVATHDVVVLAWIDPKPLEAALLDLSGEANVELQLRLSNILQCLATIADWQLGVRVLLLSDADRQYANAFLLAKSGNHTPFPTIDYEAVLGSGDYRLFNHYQVIIEDIAGPVVTTLESEAKVGNTPVPCLEWLKVPPEVHPANGRWGLTTSRTATFQLVEGRLGKEGQHMSETINGRSVPWIWSVIRFDLEGSLNPNPIDPHSGANAIFPTYFVYEDGELVDLYQQPKDPEAFIVLDETYQRRPSDIP